MRAALVLLVLLAAAAAALPLGAWHRRDIPAEMRGEEVEFYVAVRQAGMPALRRRLADITNPHSPQYGHWMTAADMRAMVYPMDVAAARGEMLRLGARSAEPIRDGAFLRVRMTINTAEAALGAPASMFTPKGRGTARQIIRAPGAAIPHREGTSIVGLLGWADLPPLHSTVTRPRRPAVAARDVGSCPFADTACIAFLLNYHHIADEWRNAHYVSVFNDVTLGEYYSGANLGAFLGQFAPTANVTVSITGTNDATACNAPSSCVEASLDMQTIAGIARNVTELNAYMSQERIGIDSILDYPLFLQDVAAARGPGVIGSISYGMDENAISESLARAFATAVEQLAAMGGTIFVASGDSGVQNIDGSCAAPVASFPASVPYVVAVGATQPAKLEVPEKVANVSEAGFTSGSGVSALFDRPVYQNATSSPATTYRTIPDVVAVGVAYLVTLSDGVYEVGGTSASTPLLAAMGAMLHSARAAAGLPSLGPLAPFFYAHPECFADVTSGSTDCGSASQPCCPGGADAGVGPDRATGLGSARFDCLVAAALNTTISGTWQAWQSDASALNMPVWL